MVFNTGAALLDAIVLAVVSREQEGDLRIQDHPGCKESSGGFRIHPVSGPSKAFRRTNAWRFTTGSLTGETAGITR